LAIEAADFLLLLPDLVLVSISPFSLPFLGAKSSSLSSASAALLFFWLGATLVGGAPFARGATSRAGHDCIGVSAARNPEQLLDIFDSEGTIPGCRTLEAIGISEVSHWTALM